jgi:sterol 3beta-glucosyltransferase
MKIGIQTWGSEGDIRPFIALAGGLTSAGHEVTLAVSGVKKMDFSALHRPSLQFTYLLLSH